jgi:hypothetical protein
LFPRSLSNNPTFQYGRVNIEKLAQKNIGEQVKVEEESESEDNHDSDTPPPSPHIINKESLILVPNGEPLHQIYDQESEDRNENSNKQVKKQACTELYSSKSYQF